MGQSCSRSLFVFLSQLSVILWIIFSCFWRIHLSKTCDESTDMVGVQCIVAGHILPSTSQEVNFWRPKKAHSSLKLFLLPSLTICLDMEQFVLVHTSAYNKSLKIQVSYKAGTSKVSTFTKSHVPDSFT